MLWRDFWTRTFVLENQQELDLRTIIKTMKVLVVSEETHPDRLF
jgi:hypothetical protein